MIEKLFEQTFKKGWKCVLFDSEEKVLLFDPMESYIVLIPKKQINLLLDKLEQFELNTLKETITHL